MNRRYLLLAITMAGGVVGLVLAFVPGVAAAVSLPDLLPTVLAGLAVVAGLYRAAQWLDRDSSRQPLPEPERPRPVTVPGEEFDALLSATSSFGISSGDQRALTAREEIETLALSVLTQYRGLSRAEARRRLNEGTWTDDQLAADFFVSTTGGGSSLRESVAGSLWGDGPFERRARHAVAELDRIVDGRGAT